MLRGLGAGRGLLLWPGGGISIRCEVSCGGERTPLYLFAHGEGCLADAAMNTGPVGVTEARYVVLLAYSSSWWKYDVA